MTKDPEIHRPFIRYAEPKNPKRRKPTLDELDARDAELALTNQRRLREEFRARDQARRAA